MVLGKPNSPRVGSKPPVPGSIPPLPSPVPTSMGGASSLPAQNAIPRAPTFAPPATPIPDPRIEALTQRLAAPNPVGSSVDPKFQALMDELQQQIRTAQTDQAGLRQRLTDFSTPPPSLGRIDSSPREGIPPATAPNPPLVTAPNPPPAMISTPSMPASPNPSPAALPAATADPRRAQVNALLAQLMRGEGIATPDVTTDPEARAYRIAKLRESGRARAEAADRQGASGSVTGGGEFDARVAGINEATGEDISGFEAALAGRRRGEASQTATTGATLTLADLDQQDRLRQAEQDRLERGRQFDTGITQTERDRQERARQFDTGMTTAERDRLERVRQFDTGISQGERDRLERVRQFDTGITQAERDREERVKQAAQGNKLSAAQLESTVGQGQTASLNALMNTLLAQSESERNFGQRQRETGRSSDEALLAQLLGEQARTQQARSTGALQAEQVRQERERLAREAALFEESQKARQQDRARTQSRSQVGGIVVR